MKVIKIASVTGLLAAGLGVSVPAAADPYGMWQQQIDNSVQTHQEDNSQTAIAIDGSQHDSSIKDHSWQDNSSFESNFESAYSDDDTTSTDNSDHSVIEEDNDFSYDYAFDHDTTTKEAEALLLQLKVASQDAGHEQSMTQDSSASGHEVATQGSVNYLDVGNDSSYAGGPVFTNNNQYTPTNVIVDGDAVGLDVITKVAGRDMDVNRGLIGVDVGSTEVGVFGDTMSSNWGAQDASGDSLNNMEDTVDYSIAQ